jgi:hypothetical protein
MRRSFQVALLTTLMGGCLGSYGDPTGQGPGPGPSMPGESGESMFNRTVAPLMQARCQTCHGSNLSAVDPDFLGASTDEFYDTIAAYTSSTACPDGPCLITFPESSILVTKGVHTGGTIYWWTPSEQTTVETWLAYEVERRDLTPPEDPCIEDPTLPECGPGGVSNRPRTVPEAFVRFAACMSYDEWLLGPGNDDAEDRYDLAIAWSNTNGGLCNGCHNVASDEGYCPGGSCLFPDSWMTFDAHRLSPSILKIVLPVQTAEGVDLLPADRYIEKGYEGGGTDHPSFELKAEVTAALHTFIDATLVRYHDYTQACVPAQQPPPPP